MNNVGSQVVIEEIQAAPSLQKLAAEMDTEKQKFFGRHLVYRNDVGIISLVFPSIITNDTLATFLLKTEHAIKYVVSATARPTSILKNLAKKGKYPSTA